MTDYLFARPSFVGGMARVLDLGSTLNVYNDSNSAEEADEKALYSDTLMVGEDLCDAIEVVQKECCGKKK